MGRQELANIKEYYSVKYNINIYEEIGRTERSQKILMEK